MEGLGNRNDSEILPRPGAVLEPSGRCGSGVIVPVLQIDNKQAAEGYTEI